MSPHSPRDAALDAAASSAFVSDNLFDTLTEPHLPLVRLSRVEADVRLRNAPTGTCILRPSSIPGCLTLSFNAAALSTSPLSGSSASVSGARGSTALVSHLLIGKTRSGGWAEASSALRPVGEM